LSYWEYENRHQLDVISNNWLVKLLGSGSGLDIVFKYCSLCKERHWYYAHAWSSRQSVSISRSHL